MADNKMAGRKRQLEWTIEEDGEKWPMYPAAPEVQAQSQAAHNASFGEWHLAVLIALVCVFLVGGWLWQHASNLPPQTKGEVTILAHQPLQTLEPESLGLLGPRLAGIGTQIRQVQLSSELAQAASQDATADGQLAVRTQVKSLYDEVAFVEVFTRDSHEVSKQETHRQTRAFRRTAQGWQAVAATDDVWGAWQTWETGHLSIRYRAIDAEAVIEAAPKLDRLYEKMRQDFGVPLTATVPTVTIGLVPQKLVDGYVLDPATYAMQLPSPSLQLVPVEMTAATALYESALYPLTGLVFEQRERPFPQNWQPIARGLRFWAWWDASDTMASQAAEAAEIAAWLYQNGWPQDVEPSQPLAERSDRVCRTYPSWEVSPAALQILLECKARLSPWHEPRMQTHLLEHVHGVWGGDAGEQGALVMTLTWETMIEYMVATYGRDALPRLISALGEHDNWQSLIPEVFGVTVEEFEAGWQAYLAAL